MTKKGWSIWPKYLIPWRFKLTQLRIFILNHTGNLSSKLGEGVGTELTRPLKYLYGPVKQKCLINMTESKLQRFYTYTISSGKATKNTLQQLRLYDIRLYLDKTPIFCLKSIKLYFRSCSGVIITHWALFDWENIKNVLSSTGVAKVKYKMLHNNIRNKEKKVITMILVTPASMSLPESHLAGSQPLKAINSRRAATQLWIQLQAKVAWLNGWIKLYNRNIIKCVLS